MKGACDICNAQDVELAHGFVTGIETFYCVDGCELREGERRPGKADDHARALKLPRYPIRPLPPTEPR